MLGLWVLLEDLDLQRVPSPDVTKMKTETVRTIDRKEVALSTIACKSIINEVKYTSITVQASPRTVRSNVIAMKKITTETQLISGFIAILVLLMLSGGYMYHSVDKYILTSHWVSHTYQVLDALDGFTLLVNKAESQQYHDIITDRELSIAACDLYR